MTRSCVPAGGPRHRPPWESRLPPVGAASAAAPRQPRAAARRPRGVARRGAALMRPIPAAPLGGAGVASGGGWWRACWESRRARPGAGSSPHEAAARRPQRWRPGSVRWRAGRWAANATGAPRSPLPRERRWGGGAGSDRGVVGTGGRIYGWESGGAVFRPPSQFIGGSARKVRPCARAPALRPPPPCAHRRRSCGPRRVRCAARAAEDDRRCP